MVDVDKIQKEIGEQFVKIVNVENEFFKQMEEFKKISDDWDPETDEDKEEYKKLGAEMDSRVKFLLREIMVRYGNLLFL